MFNVQEATKGALTSTILQVLTGTCRYSDVSARKAVSHLAISKPNTSLKKDLPTER